MSSNKDTAFRRFDRSVNFLFLVAASVIWLMSAAFIIPFGAAVTAMYNACNRSVRLGEGKFFSIYWDTFKSSFRRATPVGCVYIILAIILICCIRFANAFSTSSSYWTMLSYIYTGILISLGLTGPFLFPTLAHCSGSTIACVKLGLLLAFRHIFTSITCFLLYCLAGWIVLRLPACVLIFPGMCSLLSSMVIEPYFEKDKDLINVFSKKE